MQLLAPAAAAGPFPTDGHASGYVGSSQEQAKARKVCPIDSEDESTERSSGPWDDGVWETARHAAGREAPPRLSKCVASRSITMDRPRRRWGSPLTARSRYVC